MKYLQVREITFCNFLSILRIILPERVLGKKTNCILSNLAIGPTWSDIYWLISLNRFSLFLISPLFLKLHNHKVRSL
jgi:hypothetical protein